MAERIVIDRQDHIAYVTLNRPDKHNAVDRAMFDAFIDVGRELSSDRALRAVVLSGRGDNFCAGIDIAVFQDESGAAAGEANMKPLPGSLANYYQNAAWVWRSLPVPVIAALRGYVFGAGLQTALGADVRYAEPNARLSIMEIKWGLVPDMGITATLPGLMPIDRALELTWSGRIVEAREACELGLVTALRDDAKAAATALAESIAAKSPDAVRAVKRLYYESWRETAAKGLRLEADLQARVMSLPNVREAAHANFEKRKPEFGDAQI
ncbi:MAG: crotonase/enoyl-CoA hydratase family protein [Gammaproteobacteria bacterium]|nr:crotonase/enoyl-CoA hydratase family protein [Gammaproteobacteria bacterium]